MRAGGGGRAEREQRRGAERVPLPPLHGRGSLVRDGFVKGGLLRGSLVRGSLVRVSLVRGSRAGPTVAIARPRFRVQGSGCRGQGAGFWVKGSCCGF